MVRSLGCVRKPVGSVFACRAIIHRYILQAGVDCYTAAHHAIWRCGRGL